MRIPRRTRLFLIAHGHADLVRAAKGQMTLRVLYALQCTIPTLPAPYRAIWTDQLRRHQRDYKVGRSVRTTGGIRIT